jgi:hypothetical protein
MHSYIKQRDIYIHATYLPTQNHTHTHTHSHTHTHTHTHTIFVLVFVFVIIVYKQYIPNYFETGMLSSMIILGHVDLHIAG